MASGFGSKLKNALAAASDAAKRNASSLMATASELAAQGAVVVKSTVMKALESNVASTAIISGVGMMPGAGTAAALLLSGVKAGYDYALKGEKDYQSADPYLDGSLKDSAATHCGGNLPKEKARRRRAREAMIAGGKASDNPAKQEAAARLEKDMVGVERALLSKHVYDHYDPAKLAPDGSPPAPPIGFLMPDEDELDALKITQEMLEPEGSDFRALLYKVDPAVTPVPPAYVMAFRGTQSKADWKQGNIPQGLGMESNYYSRAMLLAKKLAPQGDQVEFTGHSLGGGLASAAAVVSGLKASTQNSAGLHDKTTLPAGKALDKEAAKSFVEAYRINGADQADILTSLNKLPLVPDAIGTPHDLQAPKAGVSRLGLHSIDAVIDSIEDQKQDDQQVLQAR